MQIPYAYTVHQSARVVSGICRFIVEYGIFDLLRSPVIYSKESIPPAYVAWRADTIKLFLFGPLVLIDNSKIPSTGRVEERDRRSKNTVLTIIIHRNRLR
jgi:hypothetical protein